MSKSRHAVTEAHPDPFPASPYQVPFEGRFRVRKAPTEPPADAPDKATLKTQLADLVEELSELQQRFYASGQHALLLVFQAMDAAGKDSTIRAVLSGVNPAGCRVHSFKQPSPEEVAHDFLWRTTAQLPERGQIGVFNRSHYEEVLAVRVHPELLQAEKVESDGDLDALFAERFESIREHERHLARNGTVILKFWLNVSKEEQARRFLSRLDEPRKNWKFSDSDLAERERWPDYMKAYEAALNATSRPWAPWFAVPADSKSFMRATVAGIVVATLKKLHSDFPDVPHSHLKTFARMRKQLEKDIE